MDSDAEVSFTGTVNHTESTQQVFLTPAHYTMTSLN